MPQTINTNVASLNAQRNLNASQSDANTALQRLSSGLRINSAKDDAAGLAISNRLTSQINGINQAIRNAGDGISVAQVAEGALSETSNILQRMRELAVQSANSSNSPADRAALQSEVTQLTSEIDRIANNTAFGSSKLLNGSFTNQQFQVGANVGETIGVTIASGKASAIGELNNLTFGTAGTDFITARAGAAATSPVSEIAQQNLTFTVGGTETSTVAVAAQASAKTIASDISSQVSGVTATAETTVIITDTGGLINTASSTMNMEVNGVTLSGIDSSSMANFASGLETAIEQSAALANLSVSSSATAVTIVDADGDDISVKFAGGATLAGDESLDVTAYESNGSTTNTTYGAQAITTGDGTVVSGAIDFTTSEPTTTTFSVVSSVAAGSGGILSGTVSGTAAASGTFVSDADISTVAGANEAISIIDAALTEVDGIRADLGAIQNRFDSVIANLSNVSENSAAARSRIQDADFAQETANLARAQILQQAGISVLAQANAQPQNVLALLQ